MSLSDNSDLLPPWTYQSPAFLQLEIEHLFKRHWMLVGHESDIREPGSFLTFDAFDEQVLVIRSLPWCTHLPFPWLEL